MIKERNSSSSGVVLRHLCANIAAPALDEDPNFPQYILFSFWKGLELHFQQSPPPQLSAAMRELFCQTTLELVQQCSSRGSDQILCAQSFCMVARMFPSSIFLDQEHRGSPCKIKSSRNQAVKSATLKLLQGQCLQPTNSGKKSIIIRLTSFARRCGHR
jgi:hypothetical protein